MYHVVKFTINVDCFIAASTNNLALNKQATQSSDWSSSLAPHKAVDGDVTTYSCTVKESNNYWSVDLGMEAMIDHLYIKNIYALSGGGLFIWQTQTELHHHNIQDAILTHWDRDKITAIFQTTLSNVFSWMIMHEFRLKCHWCLFQGVQLTVFQYWFKQWGGDITMWGHISLFELMLRLIFGQDVCKVFLIHAFL